jgi:uncharacterized protein YjbJ (UPF0337 family)
MEQSRAPHVQSITLECATTRTCDGIEQEITAMDKDRVEGAVKQAKGAVKEAVGKVTGDAKTQAEGRSDKAEGKVQNAIGGAKDAARDALKR